MSLWHAGVLGLCILQVSALPSCFEVPYSDVCCQYSRAKVVDTSDPICNAYGYQEAKRVGYLDTPRRPGPPRRHRSNRTGDFHETFLKFGIWRTQTHNERATTWLGVPIWQAPEDLMILQQLLAKLRPGLFIETGTSMGGSAFYVATMFNLLDMPDSRVLTFDQVSREVHHIQHGQSGFVNEGMTFGGPEILRHNRHYKHHVTEVVASSVSPEAVIIARNEVKRLVGKGAVIVSLDSNHIGGYVWKEIEAYAPLIPIGSYLIVQDVILSFAKFPWDGPLSAVEKLIHASKDLQKRLGKFVWDRSVEAYGYTAHAHLRRVA